MSDDDTDQRSYPHLRPSIGAALAAVSESWLPGWFRTEQNQALYENQEWVEYLCDRTPVKRPGRSNDLDAAIVFLAAESSRYVTGQTLLVDGGISTGATRALQATQGKSWEPPDQR